MIFSAQKKRSDGGKWWITFDRFRGEMYLLPTIRLAWGACMGSAGFSATSAGIYWLQWGLYGGLTKASN